MANRSPDANPYPRWMSISGEELELDLPQGLLGMHDPICFKPVQPFFNADSPQENVALNAIIRNVTSSARAVRLSPVYT